MFLTLEKLYKYEANDQDIKTFQLFYPNGAELIDVINDGNFTKEFLHWCREHFSMNSNELDKYYLICNIIQTEGFWYSQETYNTKYVINSQNVYDSISVFDSEDVTKSIDIVNSENIESSSQIFYSSIIDNCEKIYKGNNITESKNICNSTMVACSTSVIDSFNVFDSSEIINCVSVSNSHFCKDCKDIKHCMFCTELQGAEYYIFNTPIEKTHYEMIEKQYKKYLTELLTFVRDWPSNLAVNTHNIPTKKFDDWYHPISEKFWKWARTLPGYDSMLLYRITMLPEILIEER